MKLFLLILLSTLPFFSSLLYFLPTNPPPYFMVLMGVTKAFLFVAPFLFWKTLALPGSWKDFSKLIFPQKWPRQILLGIGVGVVMSAFVLGAFALISEETRTEALRRIALKISVLKIKEHFWLYGFVLSVVHSLLEEFYWRFFIFSAWREKLEKDVHKGRRHLCAHLIAGLAFTLHHFTVTVHYFDFVFGMLIGLGVWAGGMIWSYFFVRERSLLGVWISHIIVDLALISIGLKALQNF